MSLGVNPPANVTYRYPQIQSDVVNLHEDNAIAPFVRNLARMGEATHACTLSLRNREVSPDNCSACTAAQYYSDLATSLRRSTYFQTVFDKNGTQMFEFKSTAHR